MQVSHVSRSAVAIFDDPNLVSAAGLLPILRLAENAGLRGLADQWLSVPTDKGANAGLKVSSLVAGMVAGADSIDDMAVLRHGGMGKIFTQVYAPSTLGSFLRSFTFGHVRQLDAVASRLLINLANEAEIVPAPTDGGLVFVDVDDTIIEVHGPKKQGAGFGYSGVRGINALLATVSTNTTAPVVIGQRLRKGAAGSPRGAARIVADALKTVTRLPGGKDAPVLLRADSAYYGHATVTAALRAGADVSITARQDPAVKRAIGSIPDDGWTKIKYTDAIYDEDTDTWVSDAEVAEVPFTAFSSRPITDRIEGRLVVRRIPELNKKKLSQPTLFDTHRFHAFFTTSTLDTITADQIHRRHAIIEQVNADLKNSALAHLPSGVFTANAAWLVLAVIAFNLTRTAATITGNVLASATTATIRRKLVSIPARIATSGRRLRLHLPEHWLWETAWSTLFSHALAPPRG
ncbi:IS1380 family transposase [Subtercola boreus]|uniref:IS1380 family transposase n=1 Tax=Subtercola boreus TaxID=120213 RepID=UPI000E2EE11C|nr:IS1380 family transposase [Subtercola boreus]RFA17657.1 IS1380 family transposase [Subtercola boreus]RFA17880.1 IS1380 family transposase [Subtercola boreus]